MIVRLILEIVPTPAHNCGVERSFNLLKVVQSGSRCSTGPRTVDNVLFIGNNLKMHREVFEEKYNMPSGFRSTTKREYTKQDTEYWASRTKKPIKDAIS